MNPRPSPEYRNVMLSGVQEDPLLNGGLPQTISDLRTLWSREWSGSVSPDWPHVLINNPHTVYIEKYVPDPGANYYYRHTSTNWQKWTGPGRLKTQFGAAPSKYSLASTANADEAKARSRSKLISKISREKVNLAQNIGEFRQTRQMFLSNSVRIASAFRALRRGDTEAIERALALKKRNWTRWKKTQASLEKVSPKSLYRHPSSWWLELQYGWLPLLGDVHDGVTSFYKAVEQGAFIRESASSTRSWSVFTPDVEASTVLRYDRLTNRKASAKYGIRYKVDNSRLANAQDWGITNPLLLAWELVPYSFVVDWFIPVGDWLSTVGYSLGLVFHDGYVSYIVNGRSARSYKRNTSYSTNKSGGGFEVYEQVLFRRETLSSFPTAPPPLSFDSDGLRGKRIANAIALLGVAFGRKT